jgi:hypothetical protein
MYKQTTFYFLLFLTLNQPCNLIGMKENSATKKSNRLTKSLDPEIFLDPKVFSETLCKDAICHANLLALEMKISLLKRLKEQTYLSPQQQTDLENAEAAQKLYSEEHKPTIEAIRSLHESFDNASRNGYQS